MKPAFKSTTSSGSQIIAAYRDGVEEGRRKDPCCLIPWRFTLRADLSESWLKGFDSVRPIHLTRAIGGAA